MITKIEIIINEGDLLDFLHDTSDPLNAADQWCAEYERRLTEVYDEAECTVEFGQTSGMGDNIYINDELTTAGSGEYQDTVPWIEGIANQMVNDWSWLTI